MKKFILFFLMLTLIVRFGCFSQPTTATSTAGVMIIDINAMFKEYNIRTLPTMADTIHVLDSIMLALQSKVAIPARVVEKGDSKSIVQKILGQPLEPPIILLGNKEKWIYKDLFVYFKDGVVDLIQKHK